MTNLLVTVALAASALFPGVASAAELEPEAAHSIRLGEFAGVITYTPRRTGFHVVATLGSKAAARPMRVVSDMERGDSLLLSVPQAGGGASVSVTIYREEDVLIVTEPIYEEVGIREAAAQGALPQ